MCVRALQSHVGLDWRTGRVVCIKWYVSMLYQQAAKGDDAVRIEIPPPPQPQDTRKNAPT